MLKFVLQIIIKRVVILFLFQVVGWCIIFFSKLLIWQIHFYQSNSNIYNMTNPRKNKVEALDTNFLVRLSHFTIFLHIYNVLKSNDVKKQFAPPRFKLFQKILKNPFRSKKNNSQNELLQDILYTFKYQILIGGLIALIFASLNLLIPVLIKHFLHFMHDHSINNQQIETTNNLLQAFILIQILRIIFGQHAKRLFHEIAIKIESSLAIKIVSKGLKISNDVKNKISQSDLLHLQNVDLKLIFTMFKNMNLAFEAPFTILVAIFMLFNQNSKYGFIGVYWFLIAFLLQRQLDGRMTHCNDTKLKLIEDRSKVNYMILSKIKQAKISGHQDLLVQKNNDYFVEECHDHQIFYKLSTLYDIILLILPTIVIVTIALYDLNQTDHINVQQVYVLLSLLGICYNPMKAFRTMTISFHDGIWSLNKVQDYLNAPDEEQNETLRMSRGFEQHQEQDKSQISSSKLKLSPILNQNQKSQVLVVIQNNVVIQSSDQHQQMKVKIQSLAHIELSLGQRIVIMGRKGHGVQIFMESLVGKSKITQGIIWIAGKVAYLGQDYFFRNTTVRQNIRFFDETITDSQIQTVYKQLGLDQEMKLTLGIQANIDDQYKYTKIQLHKIALARIFCSKADIYILNNAFGPLPVQDQKIVNNLLRKKQKEGKIIIMNQNTNNYFQNTDKILIFEKGISEQYGTYFDLKKNSRSKIFLFEKDKERQAEDDDFLSNSHTSPGVKKIQNKIKAISHLKRLFSKSQEAQKQQIFSEFGKAIFIYSMKLAKQFKNKKYNKIADHSLRHYFLKFLTAIKFKEFAYIFFIILTAQLTHIFVHFYIGHLQQQHGNNNYLKFKNMIIVEVVLTILLSGIIYLQGEVASSIAIIQGNKLYQNALMSLTSNKISWFSKQYSIRIANRFNHDYEQLFIALHAFLNIYKNFVILFATIYFISENKQSIVIMTLVIVVTYFNVYYFLRKVQRKVVEVHDDCRYSYVKHLEQSFDGAQLINLSGVKKQFLKKSEQAYAQFASYRIAQSYTQYGQQILCDLISLIIFSIVLSIGLTSKVSGNTKSIALLGTMIHLLVGVFDVLKNIVKESVNLQTFFNKNILTFMIIGKLDLKKKKDNNIQKTNIQHQNNNQKSKSKKHIEQSQDSKSSLFIKSQGTKQSFPYTIQFDNVLLRSSKYHQFAFQNYPLTLKIQEGQKILLFQKDSILRSYLVYGLTKNLPMFFIPEVIKSQRTQQQIIQKIKTIKIGGRDIIDISSQQLNRIVQVYMEENFCFEGTIKENLEWKNKLTDKTLAYKYCDLLRIKDDIPEYEKKGLEAFVLQPDKDLAKKLMLIRIMLIKPKIIIIKDTSSLLGGLKLVEMLSKQLNNPTIIKISSHIQAAFDIERVVYMKQLQIIQNRLISQARQHKLSQIGRMLRQSNIDGYLYANLQTVSLFRAKYNTQQERS